MVKKWITTPATKRLVSLAWADFGQSSLPSGLEPTEVKTLKLGKFKEEEVVAEQERNNDQLTNVPIQTQKDVPTSFRGAMKFAKAKEWKNVMDQELNKLQRKSVCRVCPLPKSRKALGAQWVFAKKTNSNRLICYKAHYVTKGFNQVEVSNYAQTFSPMATFNSMRVLLSVAARHKWPVYNFDFVAAYLNAPINK